MHIVCRYSNRCSVKVEHLGVFEMANRQNVQVTGSGGNSTPEGTEAEIHIVAGKDDLVITVKDYLKVEGIQTEKGNITIATTHGNVLLPSNQNLSVNLWQRGATSKPRRNVTIK